MHGPAAPWQAQRPQLGDVRHCTESLLLPAIESPRPGRWLVPGRRLQPAALASFHQPARDDVEDHLPAAERRSAAADEPARVLRRQIHQQALRGHEHTRVAVDLRRASPGRAPSIRSRAAEARREGAADGARPPPADRRSASERARCRHARTASRALRRAPRRLPAGCCARKRATTRSKQCTQRGLPLREALARAESFPEWVVDPLDELHGLRIVEHRVGPPRLDRPVVERPQQGLGNPLQLHGHLLGCAGAPVTPSPRRALPAGAVVADRRCSRSATCSLPSVSSAAASASSTWPRSSSRRRSAPSPPASAATRPGQPARAARRRSSAQAATACSTGTSSSRP